MGFSTVFSSVASSALTNARDFITDMAPILGLLFGVAVGGLLLSIFGRFVNR